MAAAGGAQAGLTTGLMILGTSSAITGLAMWLLGCFKLGSAARLMPYLVAVGFLAGSGWILSFAALSLIIGGANTYLTIARSLVGPNLVGLTLPTLALSALIVIGQRFLGGVRALFGALLIALICFYAPFGFCRSRLMTRVRWVCCHRQKWATL
jgi:sulfate permease, SulP family